LTSRKTGDTVGALMSDDFEQLIGLAKMVVERARAGGADVAEAEARSGWELSAGVRLGEPELVEEAGTRSVSLRVIRAQRVAITSTSDLSEAGLERCVADALMLAELSEPDPFAGPADPSELCHGPYPELELYDPAVEAIQADEAIARARAAEQAALASDPRLTISEGASFSRSTSASALVLSSGFVGTQRGSYASLVVSPLVEDQGGKRRRGFHWTAARHLSDLDPGEAVGLEAARRTIAKLGARKVPTCEVAVIFEPEVSRSLLSTFASCIAGGAIWRKSSYLLDREGTAVANPQVSIIDDPLLARAPGSRPYDGEGLGSRRNLVVDAGVLRTFLLDTYAARKLGKRSTASASRSGGSIGASTSNFFLQPGTQSPQQIIASTERGLYVTEMMGFGFNPITGDYSRGAAGFWIEDGKLGFPVSEVTVSSNLDRMLKEIDAVGNDLVHKTATAAPTIRIASMTLAGT
jgi:PmbA protein